MARPGYRYRRRYNEFLVLRIIMVFLMLFIAIGSLSYYGQSVVKPIVNDIAEIKARSMITTMLNNTIHSQFQEQTNIEQLLIIKMNNEGNIELVQANTQAMNYLVTSLTQELQRQYKNIEPQIVKVPLGTLVGSQILSETGPYIDLKVMPINVSKAEFETELTTEGINQTKYKVYVVLTCQVRVLAPFSATTINVQKTVLIAEAVILGQVPNSYIVVPEEKILDVTQQQH